MTILQIKNKIEQFQVIKCDMYHEKVKLDTQTGQPIIKTSSNESYYERVPLCKITERSKRLGCAHSSSNNNFLHLIEELKTDDQEIFNLKKGISNLIIQIYALDHKKGDLEKELADSLGIDEVKKMQVKVKEKLSDCIKSHRKLMDELNKHRTKLILRLDQLMP